MAVSLFDSQVLFVSSWKLLFGNLQQVFSNSNFLFPEQLSVPLECWRRHMVEESTELETMKKPRDAIRNEPSFGQYFITITAPRAD